MIKAGTAVYPMKDPKHNMIEIRFNGIKDIINPYTIHTKVVSNPLSIIDLGISFFC